jgi:hypothetical protein
MEMIMNIQKFKMRAVIVTAVTPLILWLPLTASAVDAAKNPPTAAAPNLTTTIKDNSTGKQLAKEAVDAGIATQIALKALANNQPKEALAALQVASGDLHLLLAREPALDQVPIDIKVQVLEGPHDLKVIKSLKNQLAGLINDAQFQDARPLLDSLVDEIRVTVTSLPLGTYLATIDQVMPLIAAGNLSEAKQELVKALDSVVYEQDITPLAIFRAEDKLNQAFQITQTTDLSKQENKDKISQLVNATNQDINVAEALGYGTKQDYEPLYKGMDTLKKSIGTTGFASEWQKIKNVLTKLKNNIFHPHAEKAAKPA